jgi:hypothetical protein
MKALHHGATMDLYTYGTMDKYGRSTRPRPTERNQCHGVR